MDSFNLKQFLVENKLTKDSKLNEIKTTPTNTGVGKQKFLLEKWESLGEDFKLEKDYNDYGKLTDDEGNPYDIWYMYYGIIFHNDPKLKKLHAEIQYNDYDDEEYEVIEEKIETLVEILNKNNIKWSEHTKYFGIDFNIHY